MNPHWSCVYFFVSRLMNTENNLLQSREEDGGTFERALVASEFIDWLLQEGEMGTRAEAEQLGRRLLEHGIVQHGEDAALGLTNVLAPGRRGFGDRCRAAKRRRVCTLTLNMLGQFWTTGHSGEGCVSPDPLTPS